MKPDVKRLQLPPLVDHWIAVDGGDLARLLQMPGKEAFDDDMLQAVARVEEWHKQSISVWHHQQIHVIKTIAADHLVLDYGKRLPIGQSFQRRLTKSDTQAVILLGYTVGPETDAHSKQLWDEEKFDESYLVKSYSAALAEELRSHYMLTLCDWAAQQDLSLLPPEGPGYNDWPTANMTELYACLEEKGGATLKERIKLRPGGMLEPANSMLLAFGLTPYSGLEKIKRRELYPCSDCTYSPCSYRRTPYQPASVSDPVNMSSSSTNAPPAPNGVWPYAVARAPLSKWARERVSLSRENAHMIAEFVYSGSTCSNMGHPLKAILSLTLLPNGDGDYQIVSAHYRRAEDDNGCAKMCAHLAAPETFFDDINQDHPLTGMTLSEAVAWSPPMEMAGCLCSLESRNHKWRNAVQSIHFALYNPLNSI